MYKKLGNNNVPEGGDVPQGAVVGALVVDVLRLERDGRVEVAVVLPRVRLRRVVPLRLRGQRDTREHREGGQPREGQVGERRHDWK